MIRTITLLDTSVATDNLGDGIIMDAVNDVVREVFPNCYTNRVATHDYMGPVSRQLCSESDLCIVGGTNLLDRNILSRGSLWKLKAQDLARLRNVVLLGVGWRGYTPGPSALTRRALSRILSSRYSSSVRDGYTLGQLDDVDLPVRNTTCVTMWNLTENHLMKIPEEKADTVITTLTHYSPRPTEDRAMLSSLTRLYDRVLFWPQQAKDRGYFDTLDVKGVDLVEPRLEAFNAALDSAEVDFVGTRLHAGVRALQRGRRALIIAIDNRATEISKDTGLPTRQRGATAEIEAWISTPARTAIRLPLDAIHAWKDQFAA